MAERSQELGYGLLAEPGVGATSSEDVESAEPSGGGFGRPHKMEEPRSGMT